MPVLTGSSYSLCLRGQKRGTKSEILGLKATGGQPDQQPRTPRRCVWGEPAPARRGSPPTQAPKVTEDSKKCILTPNHIHAHTQAHTPTHGIDGRTRTRSHSDNTGHFKCNTPPQTPCV